MAWHTPTADSHSRAVFLSVKEGRKEGSSVCRTILTSSCGIVLTMQWDPVGAFKSMLVLFLGIKVWRRAGIQLAKYLNI